MRSNPTSTVDALNQIGQLALSIADAYEREALRSARHDEMTDSTVVHAAWLMDLAMKYEQLAHQSDIDAIFAGRRGAEFRLYDAEPGAPRASGAGHVA